MFALLDTACRALALPLDLVACHLTDRGPRRSLEWRCRGFVGLVKVDGQLYAWAGEPVPEQRYGGDSVDSGLDRGDRNALDLYRQCRRRAAGCGMALTCRAGQSPVAVRPLTLLTVSVSFTDRDSHDVQVYAT